MTLGTGRLLDSYLANEEKPESSEVVAVASEPEAQTQKSESAPEGDATLPPKEVESIEKKEEGKAEEKIEVKAEDIEIKAEEKEEEKIEVKAEEKTEVKSEEPVPKTEELKEEVPPPLPASPPPVDTAPETLSAPLDSLPTQVSPPLLDSAPAAEISVETVVAEMVAKVTQEPIQAVPKVVEEVKDAAEQSLKEPVAIISEAVKEVLDTVEVPPPVNEVVKLVETAPTPIEETPAPVEPTPTSGAGSHCSPRANRGARQQTRKRFPRTGTWAAGWLHSLFARIIDEPIKKSEDVKSSASEQVSQIQESVTVGNDSTESSKPRTPVEE
uniref:Uncharacterized protein n=1 Tax=Timema bartmani TaxID=61472 RepID=A0A7R9EMW7_9NEOP|nr:unnamed protein product [Timema bartmani]